MIELTKELELKLRHEIANAKSEAVILGTLVKNEMMDGTNLAVEIFSLADRIAKIDSLIKSEIDKQQKEMDEHFKGE